MLARDSSPADNTLYPPMIFQERDNAFGLLPVADGQDDMVAMAANT